jgi:hypothetical protein
VQYSGRGQRNICRQQLYAHFFLGGGHSSISDYLVRVIDITDVNNPTERESFWIEKLNSYVPRGLNLIKGRGLINLCIRKYYKSI